MTMKQSKLLDPIHPGEILREDFMKPLGVSINQLARDLDVPPKSHRRDCEWYPRYHGRYGFEAGNIFPCFTGNLA
jgi:hypothetical protein